MPAGTSAVMAGVGSTHAASAASAAHAARVAHCKTVLPGFNAQVATVSEMREYADCVNTLYPREIGSDATIVIKILFLIALGGMVCGVALSRIREKHLGWVWHICFGVMMFFAAPLVAIFTAAVLYGIWWIIA